MGKSLLTLAAIWLSALSAAAQKPAFPGAEGYGRFTTGGREGKVVHVTNLNDSGTGSLRQAVSGNDPKTVVFDVSGVIELSKDLPIGSNTTIAGQTAPGEGITVRYYTVTPNGNNIVIRFIRFRRGQEKDVNDGADACWTRQKTNLMLDHCSFSWSIDEVASFYDNKNFTMQWCTVAEALNNAGHNKGAHGYGGIWGGKGASFHHNFLAHLNNRSPRFNGARYTWGGYDQGEYANTVMAERVDFRNCLVYNWGTGGCYGGPGGGFINMVNNYYKYGPATTHKNRVTQCSKADSGNSSGCDQKIMGLYSRYFVNGNYVHGYGANYDWQGVVFDSGNTMTDKYNMYGEGEGATIPVKLDDEVEMAPVTTHAAETTYEKVRTYAGASLVRDAQDIRYAEEALTGTAKYKGSVTNKYGLLDVVEDQGGYTLSSETRPAGFDTDKDGMPDDWETANGLNPKDASDANTYTIDNLKQIYTNLEVYLNSLVQDIMIEGNADAIEGEEVLHYYPAYTKADGTKVEAINPEIYPDHIIQTGDATITWALSDSKNPEAATVSENLTPLLSATSVELSSVFSWGSVKTQGDSKLIEVVPSVNDRTMNKSHNLKFGYELQSDGKFQPTAVSFKISKNGTDGGNFSAYWIDADGNETLLDEALDMIRNNKTPPYLAYKKDLIGYEPSNKGTLMIVPYNINGENSKKFGLGNVVISGIVIGTTGIDTAETQELTGNKPRYSLSGQRVGEAYKGIVIVGGKKLIVR